MDPTELRRFPQSWEQICNGDWTLSPKQEPSCQGFTRRGGTPFKLLQSRPKNPKYLHISDESNVLGMRHAYFQQIRSEETVFTATLAQHWTSNAGAGGQELRGPYLTPYLTEGHPFRHGHRRGQSPCQAEVWADHTFLVPIEVGEKKTVNLKAGIW